MGNIVKGFRIKNDLWIQFMEICKSKDDTASRMIRNFIKKYVEENK